jgi:uncharacterized protein YndB with AHSA1/START domain
MPAPAPQPIAASAESQVVITRILAAPRELVFKAWTDPEHLARWYAPHGCSVRFRQLDVRPGGTYHSCIQTPDGHECWCTGEFLEVVPPARLVYSMMVSDAQGNPADPVAMGMDPEWPRETVLTVTFTEHEGQTKLMLHQTVSESLAKRTGAHPSWLQMLDRLAEDLAKGGGS